MLLKRECAYFVPENKDCGAHGTYESPWLSPLTQLCCCPCGNELIKGLLPVLGELWAPRTSSGEVKVTRDLCKESLGQDKCIPAQLLMSFREMTDGSNSLKPAQKP